MLNEREGALALLQDSAYSILGDEAPLLKEDQTLEEAALDSLDLVEIVMVIEEAEGYIIDAEDLVDVKSVGQVVDLLLAKRVARG